MSNTILTSDNLHRLLIINKYFIKYTSEYDVKSASDILIYLNEKKIQTSRATLYRCLKELEHLTGCQNHHKRNRIPYEISEDEYEAVDETGYYYTNEAKCNALDFQTKLPIPITEKHITAINNIKLFAEKNKDIKLYNDCVLISDFLKSIF